MAVICPQYSGVRYALAFKNQRGIQTAVSDFSYPLDCLGDSFAISAHALPVMRHQGLTQILRLRLQWMVFQSLTPGRHGHGYGLPSVQPRGLL